MLVDGDGFFVEEYNYDKPDTRISGLIIALHNGGRNLTEYVEQGKFTFSIFASENGYTLLIILSRYVVGDILVLNFSESISFSALAVVEKELPTILEPLVKARQIKL